MPDEPATPGTPDQPDEPWDVEVSPRPRPAAHGRSSQAGQPHRFQFTLSQLIVLMTLVAVFCASALSKPDWLSMVLAACFTFFLPMGFTVGVVYGRGYQRTFCIGALFPSGIVVLQGFGFIGLRLYRPFSGGADFGGEERLWVWVFLVAVCAVSAVFGLLAIGLRWTIESSRLRAETRDQCPSPSSEDPFPDV